MPPLEKQQVQERLKMFDELLEQDEFVQKQRERGLQEGIQKGRREGLQEGRREGLQEGRIEAFQTILVDIVKEKFPSLEDLAQQRATQTGQVDVLREVIRLVNSANDESIARFILSPSTM